MDEVTFDIETQAGPRRITNTRRPEASGARSEGGE